jgi:uncharacterized membrane protein
MYFVIIALVGAVLGAALPRHGLGAALGAALGLLAAWMLHLRQRVSFLEKTLAEMAARQAPAGAAAPHAQPEPASHPMAAAPSSSPSEIPEPAVPPTPDQAREAPLTWEIEIDTPAAASPQEPAAGPAPPWWTPLRTWLGGGNLVVRGGVVILLFGIAFLVKYAAARDWLPIEARLGGAFAAGGGLLALGWRLRNRRSGYAQALQGGGIGCMYLTLFAAARLYHAVPVPMAFGLMLTLVVGTGILAVLQDGCSLALLAAGGGFLAPVLLSSGGGSHVTLFGYYTLLNLGILGIAWVKPWRVLNLTGFVFTFGIGSSWGFQHYRPWHFTSAEAFLILFFLIFVATAVLYALRQPPHLSGMVDATLVFGLPLVVFGLQSAMVRRFEYGIAISAVTLGLFYAGLASALWRQRGAGLRLLTEAFLAMGIVFGSLAIPLALSGRWTAASWSLEGAALVWVGLRQRRRLARAFGLLLQLGAGIALLLAGMSPQRAGAQMAPLLNGTFLTTALIALAGLWSSYWLQREGAQLTPAERWLDRFFMGWAVAWYLAAGLGEVDRWVPVAHRLPAALLVVAAGALGLALLWQRLHWSAAAFPPLALWPAMMLAAVAMAADDPGRHPFDAWSAPAWLVAFGVHLWLLRRCEATWPRRLVSAWHPGALLLAIGVLSWEFSWLLGKLAQGSATWSFAAWGVVPTAALLALRRWGPRFGWPLARFQPEYLGWAPAILCALLALWSLAALLQAGDPAPLPYLPLLNPLDLAQLFVLLGLAIWLSDGANRGRAPLEHLPSPALTALPPALAFLWINALIARCVHHFEPVAYRLDALLRSSTFQTVVSLFWTSAALAAMLWACRRVNRTLWFAGAALLGLEVLKLFTFDLAGSGTVARIVSFLAVGVLMLVIGFFAPLPPAGNQPLPRSPS